MSEIYGIDRASVDGGTRDYAKFRCRGRVVRLGAVLVRRVRPRARRVKIVPDPGLRTRFRAAISAAGLVRGAYIGPAIMASHSAEEQLAVAKTSIDAAGGLRPGVDLPPCIDLEFPSGIAGTAPRSAPVHEVTWRRRSPRSVACGGATPSSTPRVECGTTPTSTAWATPWRRRTSSSVRCGSRGMHTRRARAGGAPARARGDPRPERAVARRAWIAHQAQGDALGVPGFSSTTDVDRFVEMIPGMRGELVAWYQRKLAKAGAAAIVADGQFGPRTQVALLGYQHAREVS